MLLIAIPIYGGICYSDFMMSVFNLTKALEKFKIQYDLKIIQNESLITRARNGFVAMFMNDYKYTRMLFLDSDLIFSAETILDMLQANKPIVGASYPKKKLNWDKIQYFANNVSKEELEARSCDMNYNFKYYNKNQVKIENGFAEVQDVPTGCMLIDKRALSIIINKYRNNNYQNNCAGYGNSNCFYDLFKTGVVEIDGKKTYLSEDYYFCYLARQCGISLWLSVNATMVHIGRHNYTGHLGLILQNATAEKFDKDSQLINS